MSARAIIGAALLGLGAWLGFARRAEAVASVGNSLPPSDPVPLAAPPVAEGPLAYMAIARQALAEYGNPFDLAFIMGVMQAESSFRPQVVSRAGAIGLMQIMPFVATDRGFTVEQMYQPEPNIRCGILHLMWSRDYLAGRLNRMPTQGELLSAYNGGVGRVLNGWSNTAYVQRVQQYATAWRSKVA